MSNSLKQFLKRSWSLLLLAAGCAALLPISITCDCYYRGHRPIFGVWRYWSFGIHEGNLVGYSSGGEGDFFGELDQFIRLHHAPTLGSVPDVKLNPHDFGASGPAWLPLALTLGCIAFLEVKRWAKEAKEKKAPDGQSRPVATSSQ